MTRYPGTKGLALGWIWCVGFALAGMACAAAARDRMEALQTSIKRYNEAYRWKNFQQAAAFLPANVRANFLASYEEDDKALHVEGYQILAVDMAQPDLAEVKVRYRYMLLPSVTLEQRVVTQHWARVQNRWVLEHEDRPLRDIEETRNDSDDGFGGPESRPRMDGEDPGDPRMLPEAFEPASDEGSSFPR